MSPSKKDPAYLHKLVKSQLALRGETMVELARKLGCNPNTVSIALKQPTRFPLLVDKIRREVLGNGKEAA